MRARPRCLKIIFMKFLDPAEQILLPVVLSIRADTASLLAEMATELDSSIDELLSSIAEDAVSGLSKEESFLEDVVIPDRCSTEDLIRSLDLRS